MISSRDTFYCGDLFGRLVEQDLSTGVELRRLDAQNGNSGPLFPARDGTELISFSNNEPVVARWRLDGSGPITHLIAPGYDAWQFSPDGDRLIVNSEGTTPDDRVVDVASGELVATLDGMFTTTWQDDGTVLGGTINASGVPQVARLDLDGGDGVVVDGFAFTRPPAWVDALSGANHALVHYRDEGSRRSESRRSTPSKARSNRRSSSTASSRWRSAAAATGSPSAPTTACTSTTASPATSSGDVGGDTLRGAFITAADQLFVSALGGEVTQLDLETLEPIRTFGGSRGYVQEVVGTADGSLIALRGGDRQVSLFDVATGTLLGTPITIADDRVERHGPLDGRPPPRGGRRTRRSPDLGPRA